MGFLLCLCQVLGPVNLGGGGYVPPGVAAPPPVEFEEPRATYELHAGHGPAKGAEVLYTEGGIRWQVHWNFEYSRRDDVGILQSGRVPAPVAMTIREWVLMARAGDILEPRRHGDTEKSTGKASGTREEKPKPLTKEDLLERLGKRRWAAENCNRIARVYAREDTQLSAVDRKRLLDGLKALSVDGDKIVREHGRAGVKELAKRRE